ncbi:MAG TPA: hypothetical protein VMM18_15120 [Gemmatimonadaceae bacterium]|nr:hypothetical protein [Gemmatimonadaceae bacterium]
MITRRFLQLVAIVSLVVGCASDGARARADSLHALTEEQLALSTTLSAQKDSLTRVIFDADKFIMEIDSQIKTVRGLPAKQRARRNVESPLEEQLERRQEVMGRVTALVERANTTARQLAASREREAALRTEKETLEQQLADARRRMADDESMVGELASTIQRQTERIAVLELRIDSLVTETRTLGTTHYRAYYIVGTERELLEKGVIEREGGANLLFIRPGRTLQPARILDPALFILIDQREVREIPVPDSTRRYRIVSRQNIESADVEERDETTFRGSLRIADAGQFWASSRFLILVQR